MTFLPIVARELRAASRRRMTFWSRVITVGITLAIGVFVSMDFASDKPSEEWGQSLFLVIAILAFINCSLSGVRATAECIAEEKQGGTLGLLFLTDLRGYDVVGGKLAATSLNSVYNLAALLPTLAVPLLMGGITGEYIWHTAIVLFNTMMFSLSLGMFISSISLNPRRAMAATFFILLGMMLGLGLLVTLLCERNESDWLALGLSLFNPASTLASALRRGYVTDGWLFWSSVAIIQLLSWIFLVLACIIVPRCWQDKAFSAKKVRRRERIRQWLLGTSEQRRAFRTRLLDRNPFFWLASRNRLKPALPWIFLLIAGGLWAWGAVEFRRDWFSEECYFPTAILLNTVLRAWLAFEAARCLADDRKNGALELLLSTRLSVATIIRGQFLALRRQFLRPVAFVLIIECAFLFSGIQSNRGSSDFVSITCFWICCMIFLVADSLALGIVGMKAGLTAKDPNRAATTAISLILATPTVVWALTMMILGILSNMPGSHFEITWKQVMGIWFGVGLAADLYFGLGAYRQLHLRFRELAVPAYGPQRSWFKRLFGGN